MLFSSSDLAGLDAGLGAALKQYGIEAAKVVSKGALNIKNDARAHAPHGPHTPQYASSITYDMHSSAGEIRASIGPDKNKPQGPLGNIFELGAPGKPPQPHLIPALEAEDPRFYVAAGELGEKLLRDYL